MVLISLLVSNLGKSVWSVLSRVEKRDLNTRGSSASASKFEVFRGWGFNFQKILRFFEAEGWNFFEVFWGFTLEKPQNSRWGWGQQFRGWGSSFEVFLRFWVWGFFEEKPQKTSNFEVRMRATFLRFLPTLVWTMLKFWYKNQI